MVTPSPRDNLDAILQRLERLRDSKEQPNAFWHELLGTMVELSDASAGILLLRGAGNGEGWEKISQNPARIAAEDEAKLSPELMQELANSCTNSTRELREVSPISRQGKQDFLAAVRLHAESSGEICVGVFLLNNRTRETASESLLRLGLVADTPSVYQTRRVVEQAKTDVSHYSSVLDLVVLLNEKERFLAVAMTFCNEIAARLACDRVSLGWLERGYVRVQAISHTEKFEKKMQAVQSLEAAMEEALDQDEEISFPLPDDRQVARDHEKFCREQGVNFICSLPIRVDSKAVAVLSCERKPQAFTEIELRLLRLSCDLAARRLNDLKQRDRWFGARWAATARKGLSKLVGIEHTWAKVAGVVVAIALAILFLWKVDYRVEAPCLLRTDDLAYVTVPFNGFIDTVKVRVGDEVKQGDALLTLDTRDLLLEEASALAEHNRYLREAEKARAADQAADTRVAQAMTDQARARLDLVRYRLRQSSLVAPLSGVIIEGDLRERIGAPVQQGDVLFKVARTEKIYVQCEVSEKDIHEMQLSTTGEFALASQPQLKFPVKIERIEPVAQTKEKGNVFVVRCSVQGQVERWWRPGMSGVAKIESGQRTLFWILTRRTVDFLRMLLWW